MTDTLAKCNGCGMSRLCREYEGLQLCVNGPGKCYQHREAIKALKDEEEGNRG